MTDHDRDDKTTLQRRWRLMLGSDADEAWPGTLGVEERAIDAALAQLYGEADRRGGLNASAPNVARWLGDIRRYFPTSVVKVLQRDAVDRLQIERLLLEPELLAAAEPDVHLAATLIALKNLIPAETRETARSVVRRIVDDLLRRLEQPLRTSVHGAIARGVRNRRPRLAEIDWVRTIRRNLAHYQPTLRTIIPEHLLGFGRKGTALRTVLLCIDQSGSMATSVVYASIFGAVLASIPALETRMVVFDTAVVDLTTELRDPVDLLFGAQLGGGTDIHRALSYCEGLITKPLDSILILISDLFEGGDSRPMQKSCRQLVERGVQVISLLALSDDGKPTYDHANADYLAKLGVPVFACTPDRFPELMAAALRRRDLRTEFP